MDALIEWVKGGAAGNTPARPTQADQAAETARQVREQVQTVREAERASETQENRFGALEAKVKEITEKPPREYRRITTMMWGQDTDD